MIELPRESVEALKKKILESKKILLLAHKNPDGDTIGSALAMYHYLQGLAKDCDLGCFNPPAEGLHFLPGLEHLIHDMDDKHYDLIITFDSADPKLLGMEKKCPELFLRKERLVNIDHHVSNLQYAGINLVITECASTTQVLYYLFKAYKAIFTRDIATCLLTGLYTDTGSFMHQNTTSETLRVGADLIRFGADLNSLSKAFFQTKPIAQLRLWGRVLNRAKLTNDEVLFSAITKADIDELKAEKDHLSGAIELLKYVPGIRYAEILSEENDGKVKASLRTIREDVDVAAIAGKYGGGGHIKAAGFSISGKLQEEVQWKVVGEEGEKTF